MGKKAQRRFVAAVARATPALFTGWEHLALSKYSPDQPRDDHGRFGSGGGEKWRQEIRLPPGWSARADGGKEVLIDPHQKEVASIRVGAGELEGKPTYAAVCHGRELGSFETPLDAVGTVLQEYRDPIIDPPFQMGLEW